MNGHDRFEALAGALVLNEASPAERAEFALHAAACRACSGGYSDAADAAGLLQAAHAAETWRPQLREAVVERIERRRDWRVRFTFNSLAVAACLVFVLHVGFVTGLGARAVDFMRAAGGTVVAVVEHAQH